jgi:predicted alpha/beta-hydrolase family hydrolase
MEARSRRPDPRAVLLDTVGAAAERAAGLVPGLPVFAAGKSMGGRMSSLAASEDRIDVRGLVFFGFPLHPAKRPSTSRADHLSRVRVPMLFLQGTRDTLCDLDLLRPILEGLGPRARLQVLEGADHGFHVLKRSGRTDAQVLEDLARHAHAWVHDVLGDGGLSGGAGSGLMET